MILLVIFLLFSSCYPASFLRKIWKSKPTQTKTKIRKKRFTFHSRDRRERFIPQDPLEAQWPILLDGVKPVAFIQELEQAWDLLRCGKEGWQDTSEKASAYLNKRIASNTYRWKLRGLRHQEVIELALRMCKMGWNLPFPVWQATINFFLKGQFNHNSLCAALPRIKLEKCPEFDEKESDDDSELNDDEHEIIDIDQEVLIAFYRDFNLVSPFTV